MEKLSRRFLGIFPLLMLVLGWSGWVILKKIYPDQPFTWYPYIPATFLVMGVTLIVVLSKKYKIGGAKLANLYMLLKLIKLVVSIGYILGYYFIVRTDLRIFALIFASYYAVYIACELYIFYSVEKQIKNEH